MFVCTVRLIHSNHSPSLSQLNFYLRNPIFTIFAFLHSFLFLRLVIQLLDPHSLFAVSFFYLSLSVCTETGRNLDALNSLMCVRLSNCLALLWSVYSTALSTQDQLHIWQLCFWCACFAFPFSTSCELCLCTIFKAFYLTSNGWRFFHSSGQLGTFNTK